MQRIKIIAATYILLSIACTSKPAETNKAPDAAAPQGPPAMQGDPSKNPDMTAFAATVDADKDGKMSKAEWSAKGLPESSFNMFEKGRGFVLLEDYQKNAAPPGIDGNGDGKLTVEEFLAFDKMMSEKMKGGTAPPPSTK